MSNGYEIEHEARAGGGRYVVRLPGGLEAELTYRRRDPDTVIADHTGVPPSFRNSGLAQRLVEALVTDAEHEGFKIVPACSYVEAQFRRHPEWAPLQA